MRKMCKRFQGNHYIFKELIKVSKSMQQNILSPEFQWICYKGWCSFIWCILLGTFIGDFNTQHF